MVMQRRNGFRFGGGSEHRLMVSVFLVHIAENVGPDAGGDLGGGGIDRIPGQMGIARRGLDPRMAEQLADHGVVEKASRL